MTIPTCNTLRTVDVESNPHYGWEKVELYGAPFDAFIAKLDAEGTGCRGCGAGVASYTYDTFPDEGHVMAAGWKWMTLVADEQDRVWPLCEDCSAVLFYVCPYCHGAQSVPAAGHEPPEDVDNGHVACPKCKARSQPVNEKGANV